MRPDETQANPVLLPDQVASARLCIAAIILLPLAIQGLRVIPRKKIKWVALVGLVGSGIPAFLFTAAQQKLSSSLAGILNALTPLFTLLLGIWIFRRMAEPRQNLGILIGLGGAAALISLNGFEGDNSWFSALLIVVATASYGLSVNAVQSQLQHVKSLHITAISLLVAGIPCGIYAVFSGVPRVLTENPQGWEAFGYLSVLAIMGTAVANMLYFWLTQQTNALFASSVAYLMPLVSVGWGFFDREPITVAHLICGFIILSGVYLVSLRKKSTV